MKYLIRLNTIAILLPFLIAMFGFIDESIILIALLSTMLTGIIQVIIGIIYAFLFPKKLLIKVYLFLVAFFLISWLVREQNNWIWILPPLLCAFLTVILHDQVKTTKPY